MSVPIRIDIIDRSSNVVVATHAGYPNEAGSLCLTGMIDLAPGSYNFGIRLTADDPDVAVQWDGGAMQMIVGQTVTEVNCPAETVG